MLLLLRTAPRRLGAAGTTRAMMMGEGYYSASASCVARRPFVPRSAPRSVSSFGLWQQDRAASGGDPPAAVRNRTNRTNYHLARHAPRRSSCRRMMWYHTSPPTHNTTPSRLGLGGTKWNTITTSNNNPNQYAEIVETALRNGVTTLEAGAATGGDAALCDAIRHYYRAVEKQPESKDEHDSAPLEILVRVGYRLEQRAKKKKQKEEAASDGGGDDGEAAAAQEEEASTAPLTTTFPNDVVQAADPRNEDEDDTTSNQHQEYAVHSVSPEYLAHAVAQSPVLELQRDLGRDKIRFTVLLHNPEVQQQQPAAVMEDRLAAAFGALEQMDAVDRYGVSSNGLCLPPDHPLHLDCRTVLKAAARTREQQLASNTNKPSKFRIIQLPINALETAGIDVARQIRQEAAAAANDAGDGDGIQIYSLRPLTCYPDQGTGTGRPFILADHQLPATMEKTLAWTHRMEHAPQAYEVALKTTLQHFDAEELLEKKQQGDLTAEERETLDGCKLMQSVLHDLDVGLSKVRSWAAHEDALYEQVIPVIQDTFESYDEETARILQSFFGAYSLAVRYHVARNTRELLRHGESGGGKSSEAGSHMTAPPTYSEDELPDTQRLQEFGLEFVLKQKAATTENNGDGADSSDNNKFLVDKVILGCSQPIQVVDAVHIVRDFEESMKNKTS